VHRSAARRGSTASPARRGNAAFHASRIGTALAMAAAGSP